MYRFETVVCAVSPDALLAARLHRRGIPRQAFGNGHFGRQAHCRSGSPA
ncbi:MAG: hypothetical protein MZU79_01755 [Anaerotruncus sp.]|nr:hypothetical protein [Anaerotruncus sp.]